MARHKKIDDAMDELLDVMKRHKLAAPEAAEAFVDAFEECYEDERETRGYDEALHVLDDFADERLDEEEE